MPTLIVAALSARWLAEAASREGFEVIALDVFGDVDTRRVSRLWRSIGVPGTLRIDPQALRSELTAARLQTGVIGWLAGPGFDGRSAWLAQGGSHLALLGMQPAAAQRVRDPRAFFAGLAARRIDHPPVCFEPLCPAQDGAPSWLLKDARGSGGWHIGRAKPDSAPAASPPAQLPSPTHYWQREALGQPMSATWIANGRDAVVLGCNALIVEPLGQRPYVYRGAIGPVPLVPALQQRVQWIVSALAGEFGLAGLGSVDFLLHGTRIDVLEINARPPASMALYPQACTEGLIHAHLAALEGRLPDDLQRSDTVRGTVTVFAPYAFEVDEATSAAWAAMTDCHDVPMPGARFDTGNPVCSVSATGMTMDVVRAALARKQAMIEGMMKDMREVL